MLSFLNNQMLYSFDLEVILSLLHQLVLLPQHILKIPFGNWIVWCDKPSSERNFKLVSYTSIFLSWFKNPLCRLNISISLLFQEPVQRNKYKPFLQFYPSFYSLIARERSSKSRNFTRNVCVINESGALPLAFEGTSLLGRLCGRYLISYINPFGVKGPSSLMYSIVTALQVFELKEKPQLKKSNTRSSKASSKTAISQKPGCRALLASCKRQPPPAPRPVVQCRSQGTSPRAAAGSQRHPPPAELGCAAPRSLSAPRAAAPPPRCSAPHHEGGSGRGTVGGRAGGSARGPCVAADAVWRHFSLQTVLKWLLGIFGVAVVVTAIAVPLALLTGSKSAAGPRGERGGGGFLRPTGLGRSAAATPTAAGESFAASLCVREQGWKSWRSWDTGMYFLKKVSYLGGWGMWQVGSWKVPWVPCDLRKY